ncbi:albusnodin/ikarugamycin family macrolactam cyclase [Amycolatopsis nigrescens]|uniref:albusnodin/ikarugamycin family macrolactam cyclase n=1 Tax=Amycolatopsis nigrescens TaxID=381445 RepID=UPI000378C073|nr:albusnodin/ikarugamycin family macrolactam cyclase [Amycolatopsis nigrescens]
MKPESWSAGLAGVFPSTAELRSWGGGHPGEIRGLRCGGARLIVLGQCLVDEWRLRADFLRALETGRLETLTEWPGSYLTLVFRDRELTAFVDLAGQFPLYYRQTAGRTAFGTQAAATAAAAGVPRRPDTRVLAANIVCPDVPALTGDRSVLDGVRRLGGGQAIRVTESGRCTVWTYQPLRPDPAASLAEAGEELRASLDDAVRARTAMGTRLTADFSGGLDSSSLAFLAAGHLAAPLPVCTYHHPGAPAADLEHAERFASLDRRLRRHLVLGTEQTLSYQDLGRVPAGDGPDPAAVAVARSRLRLDAAAGLGAGVHLGGEGADALLVAPPGYLADLPRRAELGRHCRVLAGQRHESPAAVFAKAVRLSRTSYTKALRGLAGTLAAPAERDRRWLDAIAWWPEPGVEATWLTRRTRVELAGLAESANPDLTDGLGVGDFAALGELRASATVQRHLIETARPYRVWPHAPFLDNDVVRACLRVPAHRRAEPGGYKPLLGRALAGLVPAPVLARRTKGDYAAEEYRGARRNAAGLRALITGSRLAGLGVLEPAAVLASLERGLAGGRAPFPALNRLIATELWLHTFEENDPWPVCASPPTYTSAPERTAVPCC